ncbi:uncharacterized protein LOC117173167 [Belonocnema kinseyi]|uniref:uncharacterized protein LOC117173167 n=1 Tax=Belonocnema kinseyi TaxID=2817044 RepID=UPI00143D31C2|nr:uncharacterized protein LOC117173167 [Belonocnema kinseyi]
MHGFSRLTPILPRTPAGHEPSGYYASTSSNVASSSRNPLPVAPPPGLFNPLTPQQMQAGQMHSNAMMRPPPPEIYSNFEYNGQDVSVWLNVFGKLVRIRLTAGNIDITPKLKRKYTIDRYLEFAHNIFFSVTTMERGSEKFIARIDNEPEFNGDGHRVSAREPDGHSNMFGRNLAIFRSDVSQDITSMRFANGNICPSKDVCKKYKIKVETTPFGTTGYFITTYKLRSGYHIGIRYSRRPAVHDV